MDAWTMTLNDVFGVFTVLHLDIAVRPGGPGGRILPHRGQRDLRRREELMLAQTDVLATSNAG